MEDQTMTASTAEYEKAKQAPPRVGDTVRVTYEATVGWINGNGPGDPGVVKVGEIDGRRIYVQAGKARKVVAYEVIEEARPADTLIVHLVKAPGEPDKVRVKAAKWSVHPQVYTFHDAAGQVVAQFEATKVVYVARESAL